MDVISISRSLLVPLLSRFATILRPSTCINLANDLDLNYSSGKGKLTSMPLVSIPDSNPSRTHCHSFLWFATGLRPCIRFSSFHSKQQIYLIYLSSTLRFPLITALCLSLPVLYGEKKQCCVGGEGRMRMYLFITTRGSICSWFVVRRAVAIRFFTV